MRRFLVIALLALCGPAWADSGMLTGGIANRQMPFDAMPSATVAWSFWRLYTSYTANKAVRIVRASDSTQTDIGFLADGSPDVATMTTFCNATTCKLVTMYGQGAANDGTQATDAARPSIQFSCRGIYPCARETAATSISSASLTPATGVVSFSAVANRSAGTGNCVWLRQNGGLNRIMAQSAVASKWQLAGGASGNFTADAVDGSWFSGQGVVNGASSVLSINGTDTTGTATGSTTAGAASIVGAASTTCDEVEVAFFDNVALTAAQRSYLTTQQRIRWGF